MTRLTMIAATLLAGVFSLPVAAQETPDTEVAPAAVGDGTSTQNVTILGGTIEATTTTGGELDLGTDSGSLSASGHAGVGVNGIGITLGGGLDDVDLPGLPDDDSGNPGGGPDGNAPGTTVADANGDGRIDDIDLVAARVAALGDPTTCSPTDTSRLNEGEPDVIASIASGDRLDLVVICAGDNALNAAQRKALAGNDIITRMLDRVGVSSSQVVGIRFAENSGTLYVRVGL